MRGIAYGAQHDGSTVAVLDVEHDGDRLAVGCDPRMGADIAQAIADASTWADLPSVTFEGWQIVGEGR